MATLGSAFYGSASPSKKRRVAVQAMMEEDEQDGLPMPSTSRTSTASPSSARASSSKSRISPRQKTTPSPSVSPDKFKLHFAGRVYRPLEYASPKEARALYTKKGNYLGQPDELVEDATAIIRCICGKITDENLMIQCEECDAWQHCRCLGYLTEEDCPEHYFCRECAPKDRSNPTQAKEDALDSASTSRNRYEREFTPPPSVKEDADARPSTPEPLTAREKAGLSDSDDGLEIEASSPLADVLSSPGARSSIRKANPYSSPGSPSSSSYAASRHLLSQASISPLIRATSSHPLLTPTKSAKKRLASMALEETAPSAPGLEADSVPLPNHYTALLNLHSAVERAILLHLATEGSRACSTAGLSSAPNEDEFHVDLPNLVTYSTIRLVVERGSGKRFGPTELGQLVWLWEGGLDGPQAAEIIKEEPESWQDSKRRGGLSISVSATRELDKVSGKKVYTWGLGIDLRIKQNVQLPAFEIVQPPGTPEKSRHREPPRSPASTGKLKRHGMSVLPLWSSKAEFRKEEMRRRLGACVVKAHEDFAALSTSSEQSTPSKKVSFAGVPTPPPSHRKKSSTSYPSSSSMFSRGFILDALPPIPSASLPPLGPAHTSPIKRPSTNSLTTDTIASVDASIAREESTSEKRKMLEEGPSKSVDDGPKVSPVKRQMSLLERIKAKEAAQAEAADPAGVPGTSQLRKTGRAAMQSVARNSLELASARAKKREVRRVL